MPIDYGRDGGTMHKTSEVFRTRCPRTRCRWEWLAPGAVFFLFWAVSSRYAGPAYLTDEVTYLGRAALLAGYANDGWSGHAGYPLLIAPLFRILRDSGQIWQGVMLLNACLWTASVVLLMRLVARFFPTHSDRDRLLAVMVAIAYPTWLAMSGYAFATSAVVLVFMTSVVLALRVDTHRWWSIVPHSAAVGFLYWVHPTALAVAAASTLSLMVLSLRTRQYAPLVCHVVVLLLLIFIYREGLHEWLVMEGTAPGFSPTGSYPSYVSTLMRVMNPQTWLDGAVKATGQMLYLVVGSFGLAVCGFIKCIGSVKAALQAEPQSKEYADGLAYTSAFMVLSIIGVILMGSLSFSGSVLRVDAWIYGRYAEGMVLPFLALGFVAGCRRKHLPVIAAAMVAAGAVFAEVAYPGGYNNQVNTIAFWPQYLMRNPHFLLWMLVGAFGVFVFQALWQEGKWGRRLAPIILVAGFGLSTVNAARFHQGILDGYSAPSALVDVVRANYEPGVCVGFNPDMAPNASLFLRERYQLNAFYLYDYDYRRMRVGDWLDECDGPLFTYFVDELSQMPGIVMLGKDGGSGLCLVAKDRIEGFTVRADALESVACR